MNRILEGLEGYVCMMDDVLVFGRNQEEHEERLKAVMSRLHKKGVTLNRDKCEFGMTEVKFLGHIAKTGSIQTQRRSQPSTK